MPDTVLTNGETRRVVGRMLVCPVDLLTHANRNDQGHFFWSLSNPRTSTDGRFIRRYAGAVLKTLREADIRYDFIVSMPDFEYREEAVAAYRDTFSYLDASTLWGALRSSTEKEWRAKHHYYVALAQELRGRVRQILPPISVQHDRRE